MRVARIIEVNGPRWIVVNEKMYDLIGDKEPPKLKDNDYHMSLEAAKAKAFEDGYRSFIHGDRTIKFREIRDKKKLKMEYI